MAPSIPPIEKPRPSMGTLRPPSTPKLQQASVRSASYISSNVVGAQKSRRISTLSTAPTLQQSRPDLWSEAFKQLAKKQKDTLRQLQTPAKLAALQQLVEVAEKEQCRCEKEKLKYRIDGWEYSLQDVAAKTAIWIQEYIDVGNIVASTNPIRLGLQWAAVRALLNTVALLDGQLVGTRLLCLERTTQAIARGAVYESLYLEREASGGMTDGLEHTLIALYTALLQFSAKAIDTQKEASDPGLSDFLRSSLDLERKVEEEVKNCKSTQFPAGMKRLQIILRELKEPLVRVDKRVVEMFDIVDALRKARMMNWISSSVGYAQTHKQNIGALTSGTGHWLQHHEKFLDWRSSSASMILWLHGGPGTGKTFLMTNVIHTLSNRIIKQSADEGLAYFYCNREDSRMRTSTQILRSFVRQLSCRHNSENIYTMVRIRYEEEERKGFKEDGISATECHHLLSEFVELYPQVTLIIDGLDECDRAESMELLRILDELILGSKLVKVLISSRRMEYISQRFSADLNIAIEATDNVHDISKFVQDRIGNEMCAATVQRSLGNFQWASLQVEETVRSHLDGSDVCQETNYLLPAGLDAAYDEIGERIALDGVGFARRAFQFMICSTVPLSPQRLIAAICQDPDSATLEDTATDIESVLYALRHLLVVDPTSNICRFSHSSVREHFEKSEHSTSEAHGLAARVCLKILILTDFTSWDPQQTLGSFVNYAVLCWFTHVQRHSEGPLDPKVSAQLKSFLGSMHNSTDHYKTWLSVVLRTIKTFSEEPDRSLQKELMIRHPYIYDGTLRPSERPILAITRFGFGEILDFWKSRLPNPNFQNRKSAPLLQLAVCGGSIWIVDKLLRQGALVNFVDVSGNTALSMAASRGDMLLVRFLLENGANASTLGKGYLHPVVEAMDNGYEDVAVYLLNSGSSLSTLDSGVSAKLLLQAAQAGRQSTVKLLAARGASYSTAITLACKSGASNVVRLLLECGASSKDAIKEAARNGQSQLITSILVEHGTDEKARQRALLTAAAFGHEAVLKLLFDYDSSLAADGDCMNKALLGAVHGRHSSTARFLLELGTPISVLPARMELLVARFLEFQPPEKFRANVLEEKSRAGNRAPSSAGLLHFAIINMDVELASILLEQGINVNTRLAHTEATGGQEGATSMGQSRDSVNGSSFSALAYASKHGSLDMVCLLLLHKAEVNAATEEGEGSALCAAVESNHVVVARALLKHGADVHGPTRSVFHSILDVAIGHSPLSSEMVSLLVEYGARRHGTRSSRRSSIASRATIASRASIVSRASVTSRSSFQSSQSAWSNLPSELATQRLDPRRNNLWEAF